MVVRALTTNAKSPIHIQNYLHVVVSVVGLVACIVLVLVKSIGSQIIGCQAI